MPPLAMQTKRTHRTQQLAIIGLFALFVAGALPTSTLGQLQGGVNTSEKPPINYLNGADKTAAGTGSGSFAPGYGNVNEQAITVRPENPILTIEPIDLLQKQQWPEETSVTPPTNTWSIGPPESQILEQPGVTEDPIYTVTWYSADPTPPSRLVPTPTPPPQPPTSAATPTTNGGGGIVQLILSPISSVYNQAKRLFGSGYESGVSAVEGGVNAVSDGVDVLRLETYKMFMQLYNKTYSPEEIPRRMALFFERRKQIEESVKNFMEGKALFYLRENDFIDWDTEELKKLFGLSKPSDDKLTPEERPSDEQELISSPSTVVQSVLRTNNSIEDEDGDDVVNGHKMSVMAESIPARMDWRDSGCVSRPINQHKCGACYAIATMSVIETMRCLHKVVAPILSPQEIVDCADSRAGYDNFGCDGGWPTPVLKYVKDRRSVSREACYPYVHKAGRCKISQVRSRNSCTVNSSPTDTSIQYKVLHNERDILYHVAKTGPVVTVMQATDAFLMYGKGIFDDWRCSNRRDDVDHAIVIVGYGRENGIDYWLIKNSWGTTTWGEGGYGKYRRGKNACSIGHWGWVVTS